VKAHLKRSNTNAAFDFAGEITAAMTLSEVVQLTSAHARKQFEVLTAQSKELSALAQKVATETAEPIKSGMNKAFSVPTARWGWQPTTKMYQQNQ
jgi:hypothetical protein